jgi:hypothetical protein
VLATEHEDEHPVGAGLLRQQERAVAQGAPRVAGGGITVTASPTRASTRSATSMVSARVSVHTE